MLNARTLLPGPQGPPGNSEQLGRTLDAGTRLDIVVRKVDLRARCRCCRRSFPAAFPAGSPPVVNGVRLCKCSVIP